MNLPPVERLESMTLREGDVIVVTVDRKTTPQQAHQLRSALEEQFDGHKVLIVAGAKLTTVEGDA